MQMNSITLVGRAGDNPEVRYYESGSVRAVFDILVNRRSTDDAPDMFHLELWGKQAQAAADNVRKDTLIGIIGSVKTGPLEVTGSPKVYVRVDRLEILGPARQEAANG